MLHVYSLVLFYGKHLRNLSIFLVVKHGKVCGPVFYPQLRGVDNFLTYPGRNGILNPQYIRNLLNVLGLALNFLRVLNCRLDIPRLMTTKS